MHENPASPEYASYGQVPIFGRRCTLAAALVVKLMVTCTWRNASLHEPLSARTKSGPQNVRYGELENPRKYLTPTENPIKPSGFSPALLFAPESN